MKLRSIRIIAASIVVGLMIVAFVVGRSLAPANAATNVMSTFVKQQAGCDERGPVLNSTLNDHVRKLGYGVPDSDVIIWTHEGGVPAGTYTLNLPRQRFGVTRQWVAVVLKDDSTIEVSRVFTFKRPAKANCVVKQNPRFTRYKKGINKPCPVGSHTLFLAGVWVKPGTSGYILRPGVGELVKRNGQQINTDGSFDPLSDKRLVEYVFVAGRRAKIVLDPGENGAWPVVTSSSGVQLVTRVYRTCVNDEK